MWVENDILPLTACRQVRDIKNNLSRT